ncbi:hypothetical protein [Methylobacterium haplocladii]|uniref:Uncharacterized protein n=1 Tax=Methylobacterium haplocladii TaxID=1176176 RepID=A0A512ILJ8_9HYPH|nr:hypothetical protein [Methylobacterium haplocladii]GEO98518.1 hypothetical protein MHA02_09060 [Methylobacterium haplocladii]GJD82823.1 hypothetical protein HPGCJGGD_0684 [Methylobacterium haplocladii]GLS60547.1 hypothetical protein GCM10007887_32260 [Methylobacterium haplocladii]
MRHPIPMLCTALGLTLLAGSALAEGPPDLDVEKTCRSSGRVQVGLSEKESQDGCLRSERAAHDELKKRWSEFSLDAKAQCSKQSEAGGFPSYVETVTCLELATGTVPAQTNGGDPAPKGAATGGEKGSPLTAEPSPKERTNPIDVLNK